VIWHGIGMLARGALEILAKLTLLHFFNQPLISLMKAHKYAFAKAQCISAFLAFYFVNRHILSPEQMQQEAAYKQSHYCGYTNDTCRNVSRYKQRYSYA
jgi:hypothetical protein